MHIYYVRKNGNLERNNSYKIERLVSKPIAQVNFPMCYWAPVNMLISLL